MCRRALNTICAAGHTAACRPQSVRRRRHSNQIPAVFTGILIRRAENFNTFRGRFFSRFHTHTQKFSRCPQTPDTPTAAYLSALAEQIIAHHHQRDDKHKKRQRSRKENLHRHADADAKHTKSPYSSHRFLATYAAAVEGGGYRRGGRLHRQRPAGLRTVPPAARLRPVGLSLYRHHMRIREHV